MFRNTGVKICTIQYIVYFFVPFFISYYIWSFEKAAVRMAGQNFYTGQTERGLHILIACDIKALIHRIVKTRCIGHIIESDFRVHAGHPASYT